MKLDLKTLEVITTSRRRYGKAVFTYATANLNGQNYNLIDPFPSSTFPKYEAAMSIILNLQQTQPIEISEYDFRQLFKGVKKGKELYSKFAERLENLGVEFN